jgi:hypothetical protein
LNELKPPLLPTRIGERYSQTISNLRQAALMLRLWTPPINERAELTRGVWNWFVIKHYIRKPQVWELTSLCSETSTKLYVHELEFWSEIVQVCRTPIGTFVIPLCNYSSVFFGLKLTCWLAGWWGRRGEREQEWWTRAAPGDRPGYQPAGTPAHAQCIFVFCRLYPSSPSSHHGSVWLTKYI